MLRRHVYMLPFLVTRVESFHAASRPRALGVILPCRSKLMTMVAVEPNEPPRDDSSGGSGEWVAASLIAGSVSALRGIGMVGANDTRSDLEIVPEAFLYAGGATAAAKLAAGVVVKGVREQPAHPRHRLHSHPAASALAGRSCRRVSDH